MNTKYAEPIRLPLLLVLAHFLGEIKFCYFTLFCSARNSSRTKSSGWLEMEDGKESGQT